MTLDFDGYGRTWPRQRSVSETSPTERDDDATATPPIVVGVGMGPDGSVRSR